MESSSSLSSSRFCFADADGSSVLPDCLPAYPQSSASATFPHKDDVMRRQPPRLSRPSLNYFIVYLTSLNLFTLSDLKTSESGPSAQDRRVFGVRPAAEQNVLLPLQLVWGQRSADNLLLMNIVSGKVSREAAKCRLQQRRRLSR